jgi:hypothetical protein
MAASIQTRIAILERATKNDFNVKLNNLDLFKNIQLIHFSLCVIHKEGPCPSRGDINRLMMMIHNTSRHRFQN